MKRHSRIAATLVGLLFACTASAAEVRPGSPAPECKLQPVGGGSVSEIIKKYRGKVVYLDFWASWCGPCAESFPFMNKLTDDLKGKGLEVLAINLDENPDDARAFLSKTPARFTVLADASGQCPQDFGVMAMPSTYVIDKTGVISDVHLGFKPGESADLRKKVEILLQK